MIGLQEILAYGALILAAGFLIRKFFFKSRKKKNDGCGGSDCGC
jgi:hypothetical protein